MKLEDLKEGDRFTLGTRTVWVLIKKEKRGFTSSMLDGSHKTLLDWSYLKEMIESEHFKIV